MSLRQRNRICCSFSSLNSSLTIIAPKSAFTASVSLGDFHGIIPVPLHSERYRQRGYNHAALLAQVCATQTGIPLFETMLIRHRATLAQVGLEHWKRQQNVQGAFSCSPSFAGGQLRGRTLLLIDDVSTTHSTLEACAAPLFAAGVAGVYGLVLARPNQ